jgi:hypothetical protein
MGQDQDSLSYQTIVHNIHGRAVASKIVSFRFSILSGNAFDTVIYQEKHKVMTDSVGSVFVTIGNGSDNSSNFKKIDWSANKYFLKTELDTTGENKFIDIGTTQILIMHQSNPLEASKKKAVPVSEDKMFLSRKYVGKFLAYRQTGPKNENGPNIIWIKTSMESTFGKISAYGKKCEFSLGNNLYIKRTYYNPGLVSGYWVYQIENDNSVFYRLSEIQYDRKVDVETWFR